MIGHSHKINIKKFFLTIILPTLITIGLFVFLIFIFIIPYFEQTMLDGKKEMLRELVYSSISIASKYEQESKVGLISPGEAKIKAITRIEYLRYGIDDKDYFWITDMHPNMIMHPYRKELNKQDLSDFSDPNGKKLFVEMVKTVKQKGEGYVDYEWQWMDDSTQIVPKISFVKEFQPWGWIIGTGIYIEDVRKEIAGIKQKLTLVSLGISVIMIFLLTLIVRQNLKAEVKRNTAEKELEISREKYKTLVEVSTEGTGMFLEGVCVYSNRKLQDIIKCPQIEKMSNDLREIISPKRKNDIKKIHEFYKTDSNYIRFETQFITPGKKEIDVLLSVSKITLGEKNGFIIVVKELNREELSEKEINDRARQLLDISEKTRMGIFKAGAGRNGKLVEVNEHALKMFGFGSKEELMNTDITDLIEDEDRRKFIRVLNSKNYVIDYPVRIRRQNGLFSVLSVSAVAERNASGRIEYISGIMKDITGQSAIDTLKADVLNDMRASMSFLNQEVKTGMQSILSCDMNTSVLKAVKLMSDNNSDAIIISSQVNKYVGIFTDYDLRTRVLTTENNMAKPVYEFMSSPVISINENANISDALILMNEKNVSHLAVKNTGNEICGIVSEKNLSGIQKNTSEFLVANARKSVSVKELQNVFNRIPFYVNALIESGARTYSITNSISGIADAVTVTLSKMISTEIGPPPVPFAFIALGSEGRREQTLVTDQDNAIIYADVPESEKEMVSQYFLGFGERMSDRLNEIGYRYCKGNIMAKNPKWCQPLSVWKKYFSQWITKSEPQDLLDTAIFFDLRCIYGDNNLKKELSGHISDELKINPIFLNQTARVGMQYKTPLSVFGKIQTESTESHSKSINIKNPCRVIVNLVRLYAMQNGIAETNTINRLRHLYELNSISSSLYNDLIYSFDFLMLLQFNTQVKAIISGREADNNVDLSDLSGIETNTLKDVFSLLSTFQSKIKYDFGIKE